MGPAELAIVHVLTMEYFQLGVIQRVWFDYRKTYFPIIKVILCFVICYH